ncbi:hypothetical protein ZIOFF_067078 [Zingiber officinale]|uniref:Uncharacterized protein n=1 Tax=Zingiber officinale TaxID=94328 RepID=A0A8J5CDD2_ZINOF|nr:hypothetical protein ZIOFF_067078 [Zingiber officinale]
MLKETYSLPKANQRLFLTSPASIHRLTDNEIAQEAPPFDSLARSDGSLASHALLSPQEALASPPLCAQKEEGALRLVRGRAVMPMRGRAHSLVDSRRIALASAAVEERKRCFLIDLSVIC